MVLHGNAVSRGIALGKIFVYKAFEPDVAERYFPEEEAPQQLAFYETAKQRAAAELQAIVQSLSETDEDKAKIFEAHLEILEDEAVDEAVRELVEYDFYAPDWAIYKGYTRYEKMLAKAKDPLISERAADVADVRNRLLRCLEGLPESNLSALSGPVVVAAHDLLPSDTATMDRKNVLAIVTETGGATSHSAIIARSYGIPAILGIGELLSTVEDGMFVIADALTGELHLQPDGELSDLYKDKREAFLLEQAQTAKYRLLEPLTKDGVHVDIGLNIGSADPAELLELECADYIGLFRTEFLYMNSDHLPTEEEQFEAYKRVLVAAGSKPVTLRTLDIGGDKTLSYMPLPKEDNPFLGCRALRLCFTKPELFRAQLRAALRASAYGTLWLMLPMVGSIEDIRRAREVIDGVDAELRAEGVTPGDYKVGIMIEIPAIAMAADIAAKYCDFASIGSNDLIQYSTAVDRMNPDVSSYYQSYHPAVFRLMRTAISAFNAAGKPISICGELGGDNLAAPVLVGMGMHKLSMSATSVASIKRTLAHLTTEQMQQMADTVCGGDTAADNEAYLKSIVLAN
ncbi:MAG: phosphoenolpyruvate--protein phosphotransferase [Oscillospiraceae bacterium]|nr:phosphoenolpyruvate--protein phosphotransferase [Oscillospiraceae bacterium]